MLDPFSAMSRRWPHLAARTIRNMIALAKRRPRFVRVSTARQGSVGYPYWGAVVYRLELGACGLPVLRATHAAGRDRRSAAGAKRDAETLGLPWMPCGPGVVEPKYWPAVGVAEPVALVAS